MKTCAYCGRENDAEALNCVECGEDEFKGETREIEMPNDPAFNFRELSPEDLKQCWVTLLTCRTLVEADLIVCQLDAAGIPTFIPDKFLMQAVSWNLNTYGYVRVQVSPKDYDAARELLSSAQ